MKEISYHLNTKLYGSKRYCESNINLKHLKSQLRYCENPAFVKNFCTICKSIYMEEQRNGLYFTVRLWTIVLQNTCEKS